MRWVVIGALSVSASGACGLFFDQQEFTAAPPDAGVGSRDATVPRDTGRSMPDATHANDAGVSDATDSGDVGRTSDTGHDVAHTVDAHVADVAHPSDAHDASAPLRFCQKQDATFCADFDEGSLAEAGFTTITTGAGVTIVLDPDASFSPPSSLELAVQTTTTCAAADVTRRFSDHDAMTSGELVFEVRPDYLAPDSGPASKAGGYVGTLFTSNNCNFIMFLAGSYCDLRVQGTGVDAGAVELSTMGSLAHDLNATTWAQVELDVTLATGDAGGTASMLVNGVSYATVSPLPHSCRGPATMTIAPGVYCDPTFRMHLDNLTFRGR